MPYATNGDVQLWYERHGSGPPLLFITGTGGDLRVKPNIFDGPFPARFDLAAYDHRGHGRSPDPVEPYAMADYAGDAVAVLDAIGWGRAHVVGVSFGGMVAQELAIRYPERVDRLVLACTSSGGAGGASYPLHELEALPEDERRRRQLAISDTRVGLDWQAEHPERTEELLALMATRGGEVNPRQLDARRAHDTFDRLDQIVAPTLVAAGQYDGLAPLANSEVLAERIPDATLRVFKGGHLFLVQDPAAFDEMAAFLLA